LLSNFVHDRLRVASKGERAMFKSIVHASIAAALVAATTISTAQQAEARGGRRAAGAVAGAIIGLGLLGAYAASRDRGYYYDRSCYRGRRVCNVVGQRCWYNRYGEYVCRDNLRCYRPRICD
jgi:hypothetical protein